MTDYQKYRNLIDDYFNGTLPSSEQATLMNKLATDTELRSEFELQKDIINTIKETRKLELKGRLDNIPVRWYHNISDGWKIAATATVITVSTLTAYYFIDQQQELNNRINIAQNEIMLNEYTVEESDVPQKPEIISEDNAVGETPVLQSEDVVEEDVMAEARENTAEEDNAEEATGKTIDVVVPNVIEDFEDVDNIDMENVTTGDINTMSPREDMHSSVEIRSVPDKKYTFHYNFSGGMLTLYGDFEETPYEILEINSASGKSFYLKFKDQFYHIENTSEISPLKPVTNEALINELKIVKENK